MESEFPLAFSKIVYKDYLYLETIFRLEYAPQNVYCFSVDVKADPVFKNRMKDLQSCFPDNVIISKTEYDVSNSGYNLSSANWACVEEMKNRKWEYVFLLQNFDVKIKTNAELVKILKVYGGANDVGSSIAKNTLYDINYNWTFASLNLFYDPKRNTNKDSNGDLQSLKIVKSLSEVTLSRAAVDYILNNMNLTTYIKVLETGSYAMDEFFIATLNSNENVNLPGGYTTRCLSQYYPQRSLTRLSSWWFDRTKCESNRWRHFICMFGVEDLRWVDQSHHFFANKFMANFDFGALDFIQNTRQCLSQLNDDDEMKPFIGSFVECLKLLPKLELMKSKLNRFKEAKVLLPLRQSFNESECIWVTMGIGDSTNIEAEFKRKYPRCKLYGIEASDDQFADFDKFGKVIPFGVGVEAGSFTLTLRTHKKKRGQYPYFEKNVTIYPVSQLLDEYVGRRIVHFMTIDLESFEYSIMEELVDNGGKLSKQGIVFCLIDAEFHQYKEEHGAALKRLIRKSSKYESEYLPISHNWYKNKHHKITFINFKKNECRRAFNIEKLFD